MREWEEEGIAEIWGTHNALTVLHCTVLHCTVSSCTSMQCTMLHFILLHCVPLHCTILHHTTVHYTLLDCPDLAIGQSGASFHRVLDEDKHAASRAVQVPVRLHITPAGRIFLLCEIGEKGEGGRVRGRGVENKRG